MTSQTILTNIWIQSPLGRSRYPVPYSLWLCSGFLNNTGVNSQDVGEVSYFYINLNVHFKERNESHHYIISQSILIIYKLEADILRLLYPILPPT